MSNHLSRGLPNSRNFFHTGLNVSRNDIAFAVNGVTVHMFVSSNNGKRGNDGFSVDQAMVAIQDAVNVANSPDYATYNVDIHVLGGLYSENVNFSRAGSNLGYEAMLWTAGGTNVGAIGKIRLIAHGYVWLAGPVGVAQPTISISRPNVEVHNFTTIKCLSTETITKTNWTFAEGGTSVHMQMPVIGIDDNYNNDDLLNGAANSVLINNCKINGGTGAGGILNNGGNWIHSTNNLIEYITEYGVAHVGSSKGTPAENLVQGCNFHQLNASATCVMHGSAVILWIVDCKCWDEDPGGGATGGFLQKQAANANAQFGWINNCHSHDNGDFEGNNTGFDATQIYTAVNGGPLGNNDLTGDNWVSGDA